jgi:putative phosphoribosyl transferase
MLSPYKADLHIPVGTHRSVAGNLTLPDNAKGLVIFSHGSDSKRLNPQSSMLADFLVQQNFGTFLFDLFGPEESGENLNRPNMRLMAERLVIVSEWLMSHERTRNIHQAYFGSSVGATIALYAAAAEGAEIAAIVCLGGRLDFALEVLPGLQVPTLFIVSSNDKEVLSLNQRALVMMHCPKRLEVISDASHLFEGKGAMEKVCLLTSSWLEQYLHPIKMLSK